MALYEEMLYSPLLSLSDAEKQFLTNQINTVADARDSGDEKAMKQGLQIFRDTPQIHEWARRANSATRKQYQQILQGLKFFGLDDAEPTLDEQAEQVESVDEGDRKKIIEIAHQIVSLFTALADPKLDSSPEYGLFIRECSKKRLPISRTSGTNGACTFFTNLKDNLITAIDSSDLNIVLWYIDWVMTQNDFVSLVDALPEAQSIFITIDSDVAFLE